MLTESNLTAKTVTFVGDETTTGGSVVERMTGVYPEALRRRLIPAEFQRDLARM
jgi:hypothetical protein